MTVIDEIGDEYYGYRGHQHNTNCTDGTVSLLYTTRLLLLDNENDYFELDGDEKQREGEVRDRVVNQINHYGTRATGLDMLKKKQMIMMMTTDDDASKGVNFFNHNHNRVKTTVGKLGQSTGTTNTFN